MEVGLPNKLENIQVLRFIAAFSVMMVHLPIFGFGGWGVDIFFVISGFIMMYITETENKFFIIKRFIRIIPLYWILTIGVFIISFLKPELLNNTTANIEHLFKSLFFIPFDKNGTGHFPILFLGWTLNYEIIFYLIFAVSLLLFRKYRLIICSTLILLFYLINNFFSDNFFISQTYSNTIMFEFIYGMIIYELWKKYRNKSSINNLYKISYIVVFAGIIFYLQSLQGLPRLIRWGIPAAFLCIFFILLIENFKFPKIFVTLGDASYSLYLIHPYIIQFFYKITGLDDQNFLVNCLFTFLIIIITLYISVLVFKLIEKPTNNLLRGFLRIT
tara:strand:- start:2168 stop:3157 length:990 start_codon:yes stop_codon:yes gene_type:complete